MRQRTRAPSVAERATPCATRRCKPLQQRRGTQPTACRGVACDPGACLGPLDATTVSALAAQGLWCLPRPPHAPAHSSPAAMDTNEGPTLPARRWASTSGGAVIRTLRWYPRPDSNRHGIKPGDFKSPVSTIPPRGPWRGQTRACSWCKPSKRADASRSDTDQATKSNRCARKRGSNRPAPLARFADTGGFRQKPTRITPGPASCPATRRVQADAS